MKNLIISLTLLLLSGCDAPIANQVSEGSQFEKENDFNLKHGEVLFTFEEEELELFLNWYEGPYNSSTQESGVLITIVNEEKEAFSFPENFEIVFEASMPIMGHGVDNSGFFKEISPGLFRNGGIRFQMPGKWLMKVLLIDYENFDAEPVEIFRWESFI